jgi:hypothetical protein
MSNFSDLEVDFETYVAPDYEFRPRHESERELTLKRKLAAVIGHRGPRGRLPTYERELVELGKPKLVRPKRRALDLAVGLMLRTPVPGRGEEVKNSDELAHLERNALAVAKHIGRLNAHLGYSYPQYREGEPLHFWLYLARTIQLMFEGRRPGTIYPVGNMVINLACKSDGSCFMTVRPRRTEDALIYHAAQMIAKGTISQTCKQCGTTFLSGGAASGKDKKRGDARFCSDECRWKFHNESRRRAR